MRIQTNAALMVFSQFRGFHFSASCLYPCPHYICSCLRLACLTRCWREKANQRRKYGPKEILFNSRWHAYYCKKGARSNVVSTLAAYLPILLDSTTPLLVLRYASWNWQGVKICQGCENSYPLYFTIETKRYMYTFPPISANYSIWDKITTVSVKIP